MFNYTVHPQYLKVQINVCVISWLFKLILNLIILCICFFNILVLYASLVHMIDWLFLKYSFSLASFACSYFTVIPSDPSVSTFAYSNCRTTLLLSGGASDDCLLAKNVWCILQGPWLSSCQECLVHSARTLIVFLPRIPGAFYKDPDCLLAKNVWCILQGPWYICKYSTCSGMLNFTTLFPLPLVLGH
jgi:hypothetical protein